MTIGEGRNEDRPVLELLHFGQEILPDPEKALHLFPRTMASDLEVLILIPAASHAAANRSSDCWRSRADDANRTTSSAKSRDPILRSRNRTPSTP
ncbi:hypothetical protein D4764_03G0011320 [Takifugu flavidus]|uniref:Uncharacterized protein n=1 Tax=Takifugu flavidus TaxID=433684 RepID=A0A5C6N9E4_9TELE|nr:hypothetical protein D4764_03G0011320 [Takifugu flavidus]